MSTRVFSKDGPMLDIRLSEFTAVQGRNVLLEHDALASKIRYASCPSMANAMKVVYSNVNKKEALARIVGHMNDYHIIPKGYEQLLNFIDRGIQVGERLIRYDQNKEMNIAVYKLLFGMFKRDESQLADEKHHQCFKYYANDEGHICTPLFTIMMADDVNEFRSGKVKLRAERLGRGKSVVYCYTQEGGCDFYIDDVRYRTNLAAFSLIDAEVAFLQKRRRDKDKAKLRVHRLCYFMFSSQQNRTTSTHFVTEVVFQHARLHYKRTDDSVTFELPHLTFEKDEHIEYSKMTSIVLKYYIMHIYGLGEKCKGCSLDVTGPLPKSLALRTAEFPLTRDQRAAAVGMRRSVEEEDHEEGDDNDGEDGEDGNVAQAMTPEQIADATICLSEKDSDTYKPLGLRGATVKRRQYVQLRSPTKGATAARADIPSETSSPGTSKDTQVEEQHSESEPAPSPEKADNSYL